MKTKTASIDLDKRGSVLHFGEHHLADYRNLTPAQEYNEANDFLECRLLIAKQSRTDIVHLRDNHGLEFIVDEENTGRKRIPVAKYLQDLDSYIQKLERGEI